VQSAGNGGGNGNGGSNGRGGLTTEKKKDDFKPVHGSLTAHGPAAGARVPSYSSLSNLVEEDEQPTPKHSPAPAVNTADLRGPAAGNRSNPTGTLSPLPLASLSPSGTTSAPGGANPPIPPTVPAASAANPGGMGPIPKTISVQEYQSGLASTKPSTAGAKGKEGSRVKNMAASIDDKASKEKRGEEVVGASASVGLGLGTGLQPRR